MQQIIIMEEANVIPNSLPQINIDIESKLWSHNQYGGNINRNITIVTPTTLEINPANMELEYWSCDEEKSITLKLTEFYWSQKIITTKIKKKYHSHKESTTIQKRINHTRSASNYINNVWVTPDGKYQKCRSEKKTPYNTKVRTI